MSNYNQADGLSDFAVSSKRARESREAQIKSIVSDVINNVLPAMRNGERNPQYNGKSWEEWSADKKRIFATSINPPRPIAIHQPKELTPYDEWIAIRNFYQGRAID